MTALKIFAVTILMIWISCCYAAPKSDGKYDPNQYNTGRYIPRDEGRYVHKVYPYVHVHDNRELGVYRHIHIPYDGGFGPYNGTNIPYLHDDHPYRHEEHTVSTLDINPDSYDIPIPAISLEYGFPDHTPERKKRSIGTNAQQQSLLAILPIHYYISSSTTTAHDDDQLAGVYGLDASQILIDSQTPSTTSTTTTTTTTTTPRPRIRYDDEGKWKIIRQEEEKKHHKYDYLYLTENGIYAEEQAKLRDEQNQATGTSSKGFYEYTGDDGKLYRVHYTVGEQGFVPEADHIPTPPPVPLAIQKALDYVAAQKRASALRLPQ